ncbi:MAG: methylmalonyl-CoA mutase family protein, partial [Chloroflexi bacterium]|nr:methylmalonyl-CoA mutase family protein [Chloroflexota bacterium]
QSLHTNSRDEALALPTEESVQIALRTQQIIAHESGVADTIDPLAGSYFVESITDELERRVERYLAEIEAMGGALPAIERGYFQREIQESSYRYQKEVEDGLRIVVGVNRYNAKEPQNIGLLRVDPAVQEQQAERLRRLRQERDNGYVRATLGKLEAAALGTENTMPAILTCVEAYATLGEICAVLRRVFGEYRESLVF